MSNIFNIYVDGASRGNPGPAGVGVFGYFSGKEMTPALELGCFLGRTTNNVAEYAALALAFHAIADFPSDIMIHIHADSQLMVRQINGEYKVRNPHLLEWFRLVHTLSRFRSYRITHVFREKNTNADHLANRGIDNQIPLPASFETLIARSITSR